MGISNGDWFAKSRELELRVRNFVDGRWVECEGEPLIKFGPRDGQLLCQFGAGTSQSVDSAVQSARRAFDDGRWSKMPLQNRRDVLQSLSKKIEEHRDELALLECLDVGKPISDAFGADIPIAASFIRWNAEAADKIHSDVYCANPSNLSYQLRRPTGVVAAIVGWNFPLVLAAQKIGPALSAGNSLVLKPSEATSLATARIAELAVEAGVPEGVFNVIHGGPATGSALAYHGDVDLLSFTGSSRTGKKLLVASGESNMKRLILECGGKAPNIVFGDCPELDAVADAIMARAFWNQGEVCSASSRLLVEDTIKDELLRVLIQKVSKLQSGDPLDPETRFGALVNQSHLQKVLDYIRHGEREGANIVHQSAGLVPVAGGYYVPPTIFDNVLPNHKIAQEEIFGPVLSVLSFHDEDEAIRIANGTSYGLTAIVWTQSLSRAHRVSLGLRSGSTVVNATASPKGGAPLGMLPAGGHKESGFGIEGGMEGLEEYMSKTSVQLFV